MDKWVQGIREERRRVLSRSEIGLAVEEATGNGAVAFARRAGRQKTTEEPWETCDSRVGRERQLELVEWKEVSARRWEKRVKRWP